MLTNRTIKAIIMATLKTKAFWRLVGTVALLAGLTIPEGLLELVAELVREVLTDLGTTIAAGLLVAPWAALMA